jgi:hypothetical protein
MPQHFKVHELLSREELDELETFAREPGRTVLECFEWLAARGFVLSHGAVGNWKKDFHLTDQFASSNASARALMDAAKSGGAVAIGDAAALQLSQMLFEQMTVAASSGKVTAKDLWAMSMALKNTITSKRHLEKLRGEVADALAEAEKSAKSGASPQAVVERVRELLGIAGS